MAYNKSDLVSKIAQKSNLTKAQAGLFSAERVKRAERTGRNPRTGETIKIPASYGVRISAGSLLKKAVTK